MRRTLDAPLAVLTVTVRAPHGSAETTLGESASALRETARRMGIRSDGHLLRVHHSDAAVIEVCLPLDGLPAIDPPPPIAAEVLVPGTVVDTLAASDGGSA